jgi:hypothetical protein
MGKIHGFTAHMVDMCFFHQHGPALDTPGCFRYHGYTWLARCRKCFIRNSIYGTE